MALHSVRGPAERSLLEQWNATDADYPRDVPLTALLQNRSPDATALEASDEHLSYAELHRRADLLAARLRARGIERDAVVGVYLDRHPRMLEAILGVLEAGGAYLPLDPAFPRERLAFMITDARVRVLLTRRELVKDLPPHDAEIVCVDEEEAAPPLPKSWRGPDATSLAYVLYTSGSTGKPKGVEVPHRALVNFLHSMARAPGLTSSDVLLSLTTLSFDIAGLELWLPLLVGAKIVLGTREMAADGELLQAALAKSKATAMQATPTTWRNLFASGWQGDRALKAMVGGEALPLDLAAKMADACGEAWNLYGPTETTIWSSLWRIPRGVSKVRIGRPIANTQLRVLDAQLRELPIGVAGELWIGGDGVARGYLGRPELTAERFVPDPFRAGGRLYRTGDLARWLPEGELEFLGRNDDQLKVRGYRIEPGEIEAALHQLEGIAQAAVALHEDRLVAYVVATAKLPPSADLRAMLRERLADYLVPQHFIEVPALPLTPNGKLDRKRLDTLWVAQPGAPETAEPLEALEEELIAQFSALLGSPANLDTDFFEAGGDSLTALRLVEHLSRGTTGGELFVHATPRRLAAHLRASQKGAHLLQLREGTGAPLVFVHPIGGEMLPYVRLAQQLSPGAPVFGLQALEGEAPFASLEDRCTAYAEELKRAFTGPIYLGGYSLGGVLAMELAKQLRGAGREVRFVFLLDSTVPRPALANGAKARNRFAELRRSSWNERKHWLGAQLRRFTGREWREQLMLTLGDQATRWSCESYDGRVLLFACEFDSPGQRNASSALGWDAWCTQLEVISLPGDHNQIVVQPTVGYIAREIESRMRAQSTGHS